MAVCEVYVCEREGVAVYEMYVWEQAEEGGVAQCMKCICEGAAVLLPIYLQLVCNDSKQDVRLAKLSTHSLSLAHTVTLPLTPSLPHRHFIHCRHPLHTLSRVHLHIISLYLSISLGYVFFLLSF